MCTWIIHLILEDLILEDLLGESVYCTPVEPHVSAVVLIMACSFHCSLYIIYCMFTMLLTSSFSFELLALFHFLFDVLHNMIFCPVSVILSLCEKGRVSIGLPVPLVETQVPHHQVSPMVISWLVKGLTRIKRNAR